MHAAPHRHGLWILAFVAVLSLCLGCAVYLPRNYVGAPRGPEFVGTDLQPVRVDETPVVSYVGGPRVDHAKHMERGLDCTDCHELDEETGEPGAPTFETCMDCHEDLDEKKPESEQVAKVFFDAEENPLWQRALSKYADEVRFGHQAHEKVGECTQCHGTMAPDPRGRPARPVYSMDECMRCHQERSVANECQTCHAVLNEKVAPPSHAQDWQIRHGRESMTRRVSDVQSRCSMCHNEPQDCDACHQVQRPSTHGPAWQHQHGRKVLAAGGSTQANCTYCHKHQSFCDSCHEVTQPLNHQRQRQWTRKHGQIVRAAGGSAQARCTMCHKYQSFCESCHEVEEPLSHKRLWTQRHGKVVRAAGGSLPGRCAYCHKTRTFCDSCHLDEQPRNHTALFRTRTHGVLASIDRQSCATCHHTAFCVRCHEDTAPRSHRAGFATGRNTHCVQCHFPISNNQSCRACHFSNPTHSTAPPQPAGHIPGRNCRLCHNPIGGGGARPLRHLDNGQNCEACHR